MAIGIDKNIPVPVSTGRAAGIKYPWNEMSVGDSFVCQGKSDSNAPNLVKATNYRLSPKQFKAAKMNGVYRIWRIK
jgi:hypothetical protein